MSSRVAFAPVVLRPLSAYAPGLVWLSLLVLGMAVQAIGMGRMDLVLFAGLMLATATQIGTAIAYFGLLNRRGRLPVWAFLAAAGIVALAPFLIPEEGRMLRFVTSCTSVITAMKLWDLHVHIRRGGPVEWSRFLPFLVDGFAIVLRKRDTGRRRPCGRILIGLRRSAAGMILGTAAFFALRFVNWSAYPLLAEHAVKALVIFVAVLSWASAMVALVRLTGGTILDFSEAPLLARTPADFWRRYNLVFRQYFDENVFKPAGGRRSPALAILFIFLLSALIHEYVFGIAIGRVQGFQTAFFLIQGIAVAATARIRPRRPAAVAVGIGATLLFNLASSLLFFLSFHAITPLYVNQLPGLLQR